MNSVMIMMPVKVAAKFCEKCPEMELKHTPDVIVYNKGIIVRHDIVCKHLHKCIKILEAKEKADDDKRET